MTKILFSVKYYSRLKFNIKRVMRSFSKIGIYLIQNKNICSYFSKCKHVGIRMLLPRGGYRTDRWTEPIEFCFRCLGSFK